MTLFERVLFVAGIAITLFASIGLCAQVYAWRTTCVDGVPPTLAGPARAGC